MSEFENNPIIILFETVACLHRKGYERLRIMTSLSSSGMYFRMCISSKKHFDNKTGFVLCMCKEDEVYRYSTSGGFIFFGDELSMQNASVEEVANKLLNTYPKLEKEGKGDDKKYVAWFLRLLEMVKKEKYPYAFSDYGYNIFTEGKIKFINCEDSIEYAPAGECDYKDIW